MADAPMVETVQTGDQPEKAETSAAPDAAKPSAGSDDTKKTGAEHSTAIVYQEARNHTIVLVQTSKHDSTRFYFDCPSTPEAIEAILKMYETRLKELNPGAKTIHYDINSLTQYVDDLRDIHVLSWEPSISGYKRWDRKWIKAKIQELLIKSAQPRKK